MISAHSHIFALFLRGHHTQQSGPDTNFLLNNSLCQQKLVADRICQPVFSLAFYSRVELPSSKRVNRLNRFESCQGSLRNKSGQPITIENRGLELLRKNWAEPKKWKFCSSRASESGRAPARDHASPPRTTTLLRPSFPRDFRRRERYHWRGKESWKGNVGNFSRHILALGCLVNSKPLGKCVRRVDTIRRLKCQISPLGLPISPHSRGITHAWTVALRPRRRRELQYARTSCYTILLGPG